jgi:hypothetical protein
MTTLASPENAMLSSKEAGRAAALLSQKFGEVAIATAMLRSHEAALRGAFVEMVDWRRIAERALRRLEA